jgi:hypothetical protein
MIGRPTPVLASCHPLHKTRIVSAAGSQLDEMAANAEVRSGSFASSVLPAEAAPARNQTLQTFHEPLKNLLSKVAVRTRDARASK